METRQMLFPFAVILLILVNVAIWVILSVIPRLKHRDIIFIILSFLSLWIFLSIREPYSDAIAYENYFNSIDINHFEMVFEKRWEILFKVLLYGIKIFTDNARVMFSVVSFITLIGPFLFIKKYSGNYLLSVVMFIAIGSFNMEFYVLRQAIAVSIFLGAFYFINNKKLIKYCMAICIASLFHRTALILLLLYPLVNIHSSKYKTIAFSVIAILSLVFSSLISNLLMSDFYNQYTDKVFSGGGINLFLFYIFMYVIYILFKRRSEIKEKESITKASIFTILMQFFTIQNNAFSRIAAYTQDSFCILIPNLVRDLKGKDKMLFSAVVIVVCISFVIVTGAFSWYNTLL